MRSWGKKARYFVFPWLWLGFFLFVACEIKQPLEDEAVAPLLSDLIVPARLYLLTDAPCPVSVRVEDPQGWEDIQSVMLAVYKEGETDAVLEGAMRDDGQDGDIIPRDGFFHYSLTPAFAGGETGWFRIEVVAEDADRHASAPAVDTVEVVDGEMNLAPVLSDPVVPDTLDKETRSDVFVGIRAQDPQGAADIDSVVCQVYAPNRAVPSFQTVLADDGTGGDAVPGDGLYSYRGDFSDVVRRQGVHAVRFAAVDRGGLSSSGVVASFMAFPTVHVAWHWVSCGQTRPHTAGSRLLRLMMSMAAR